MADAFIPESVGLLRFSVAGRIMRFCFNGFISNTMIREGYEYEFFSF